MEQVQRQTAHKIWISSLLTGNYVKTTGEWEPNYIETNNLKISRVNVIAHIVDKFVKPDNSYISLTLDDGSGKLSVKAWKEDVALLDYHVGELLLVVGKIKDFNNQFYLVPEVVTKLDNPLWAKLRNLELKKMYGEAQIHVAQERVQETPRVQEEEFTMQVIEEKVTNEVSGNKRQKLLDMIEQLDTNNGADQQIVISQSGIEQGEAQKLLDNLIKEGEIFEIHPGKLRTTL